MNKTKTAVLTFHIELTFDPESEQFQTALQAYKECYGDPDAEEDDLLKHVAYNVHRQGSYDRMIEGVGYVMKHGVYGGDGDTDLHSGIEIDTDDPDADIEIED